MSWLPKSPKARRRLWVFIAVAPVLALAVALSLYAMRDSVTFFFSPSEATPETAPAGRVVRLGGLVETGSVVRDDSGQVAFAVTDNVATTRVVYRGDLPDLFAEGQGVVAQGAFLPDRSFRATQVLAKHDETYMPREDEGEGADFNDHGRIAALSAVGLLERGSAALSAVGLLERGSALSTGRHSPLALRLSATSRGM